MLRLTQHSTAQSSKQENVVATQTSLTYTYILHVYIHKIYICIYICNNKVCIHSHSTNMGQVPHCSTTLCSQQLFMLQRSGRTAAAKKRATTAMARRATKQQRAGSSRKCVSTTNLLNLFMGKYLYTTYKYI